MNYKFAPGWSEQDEFLRQMFQLPNKNELITNRFTHFSQLLEHLENAPEIVRPIDDIFLGAHASTQVFDLPMFPSQVEVLTNYETFEAAIQMGTPDPSKNPIAIPDALTGQDPNKEPTHFVRLKGCNIGKTPVLLLKMKEALGGHIKITAPLHLHGLYWVKPIKAHPTVGGVFEYMSYYFQLQFRVGAPDDDKSIYPQAPTRTELVNAFDAKEFQYVNGSRVLRKEIEKWIPKKPNELANGYVRKPRRSIGATVGGKKTIQVEEKFVVDRLPFVWNIHYPQGNVPAPIMQQDAFQADLRKDPTFKEDHPFPQWARIGYSSFDQFFQGYVWHYEVKKDAAGPGATLAVTGTRIQYTIVTSITLRTASNVDTGKVVFNFHSYQGSEITNMRESDASFFTTV